MIFKSAVDRWFYMSLSLPALAIPGVVLPQYLAGNFHVLEALLMTVVFGLPIWLLLTTRYQVSTEHLKIRSGPFTWTIPLAEIHAATPSRSLLSSPALSLDRIAIDYGKHKRILVSPADKEGFLRAIGQA